MSDYEIMMRNRIRDEYCFSYFEVSSRNASNLREVYLFFSSCDAPRTYDSLKEGEALYFIIKGADVHRVSNESCIGSGYRKVIFNTLVNEIRAYS